MKSTSSGSDGVEMRIVAVDDNPDDIELIELELARSGISFALTPARNRNEFVDALALRPNIVLSDYSMPGFGAMDVIDLTRSYDETVPVIIISGSIGEDVAVEAMKRGASDYLLKDRLGRLPKALQNALERRRLDRARRDAEASRLRLAAVIEATPDFVVITDLEGQPVYLNAAAQRVCGPEVSARPTKLIFGALFPTITGQALQSAFAAAARVGFWQCETTLRDFADWETPVFLTIVAHFDDRRETERFSLLARDITVQKAALTELQQNQSLLRMASRLGRIGAWTVELPQMQITWSEEIIDMDRLARDVAAQAAATTPGVNPPRFRIGSLPPAHGDLTLIRQVLVNLVGNAVKYAGKQAEPAIEISGEARNGETIYAVKDNGVGFDEKYAGKLFGVFQRLHSEEEFEGTGVGLAIVQRIIHRHHGRVWADSKPGHGATFRFSLPSNPDSA